MNKLKFSFIGLLFAMLAPLALFAQADNGHQYKDGLFTFKMSGQDAVALVKCDKAAQGDVEVKALMLDGREYPVVGIDDYAFENCDEIARVQLPPSLKSIGFKAFNGCRNMSAVNIPNGVTTIGVEAFAECTGLQTISIPASVTLIGDGAFLQNWALRSIKVDVNNRDYVDVNGVLFSKNATRLIAYPAGRDEVSYSVPSSTTTIGTGAFAACKDLVTVVFPSNLVEIRSRAFQGCQRLSVIALPSTIEVLDASVFSGCKSLKQVTLPAKMARIGNKVFENCEALSAIVVPDGVTEIGLSSFAGCKALKSVTLPRTLRLIGAGAFDGCEALTDIHLFGLRPPKFEGEVFGADVFERATLYTKYNAVDAYKYAADWMNFKFIYKEHATYKPYGGGY